MLMDSCSNIGLGVLPVIQWCLGCSLGKDKYNHPHFKTINELLVNLSRGLLVWGVVLGLSLYVRRTYFVSLIGDVKRTSAILYTLGHSDGRVFKALLLWQCRARCGRYWPGVCIVDLWVSVFLGPVFSILCIARDERVFTGHPQLNTSGSRHTTTSSVLHLHSDD